MQAWTKGGLRCQVVTILCTILLLLAQRSSSLLTYQKGAITPLFINYRTKHLILQAAEQQVVEVCGSKDCRRSGGGKRLEKMVSEVVAEKGMEEMIIVTGCDCQGECGYGPNVIIDGKLFNGVSNREEIAKLLGLEE